MKILGSGGEVCHIGEVSRSSLSDIFFFSFKLKDKCHILGI